MIESRHGERALWQEVLLCAIGDALIGVPGYAAHDRAARLKATHEARDYILRPNRDFDLICNLAGVDPEATRERLSKQIAEAPPPEELMHDQARLMKVTAFGRTETVPEWSKITGLPIHVIRSRLALPGWTPERALKELAASRHSRDFHQAPSFRTRHTFSEEQ
ncbi:hypothetical protein EYE35_03195 [Cereibacter sphaeroides]|nr:hypothetical protein EYE35_03195 [Cereibacter sphaeroides]